MTFPRKSPKPIRESFAPYKGRPSTKRMLMVRAWSFHGRRHGAHGLIPEFLMDNTTSIASIITDDADNAMRAGDATQGADNCRARN